MVIRDAAIADLAALIQLNREIHDIHVRAEPGLYRAIPAAEVEAFLRDLFASEDVQILVAEDHDGIAGCAVLRRMDHPGHAYVHPQTRLEVEQLVVSANRRRRGIGRSLMRAIEDRAQSAGIDRVELTVRSVNSSAMEFYRALGYAPVVVRLGKRV